MEFAFYSRHTHTRTQYVVHKHNYLEQGHCGNIIMHDLILIRIQLITLQVARTLVIGDGRS